MEAVKSKLAVAMDIKTAVDGHPHIYEHDTADNRGLQEMLVSDLADEFQQGTPPSKDKLHALFDRKEKMARHNVKTPHVSQEEQLWHEQFDRALAILEK